MQKRLWWWAVPFAPLILIGAAVSQTGHSTRTLSINGHVGEAIVYEIDGKSYVDLESLVHIANGSISYGGDLITLTLPAADNASADSTHHPNHGKLSPQFRTASVQTLAVIKEWTNTLAHAVQKGVPGDGSRLIVFHDRATEALHLAQVAASSDSDRDALQLLTNNFHTLNAWSDKLIGERKRMDTAKYSISENAIKNDETYQKIAACNKFLSSMLPHGVFQDNSNCR